VRAGLDKATRSRGIAVTFGLEGDAEPYLGEGWSGPEPGYQWTVGERSLVTLPDPGPADEYWLEMEVTPYVMPPLLPSQRLDIAVNGIFLKSYEVVPRGTICCAVPGNLVMPGQTVRIMLDHPNAASPVLVAGGGDDRRLAIAFNRLSLMAL
jgi:hypothetical protein